MKIKTNNHPRFIIDGSELTEKERKEFEYIEDFSTSQFTRYKGQLYDLGEFLRVDNQWMKDKGWNGYISDSYFSGIVIRFVDSESVIIGTYLC